MAYSQEDKDRISEEIFLLIANDGLALRNILKRDGMPSVETFYKWLKEDENKSIQYARATEIRADKIFDEILTISDATAEDIIINEDGQEVVNHNVINRDRLRIDSRKWILSKMQPKKYGDKIDVTSGDKPINTTMQIEVVQPKDED